MASLVGPDGTSFELAEGENLIGRGGREFNDPPKVDVGPLPGGATVSRRHARVFHLHGRWTIHVEPEARNPTLIGGRRVPGGEDASLTPDTEIQLGDVILTFRAPAAPPVRPDATIVELAESPVPAPAAAVAPVVAAAPPQPSPASAPPQAAPIASPPLAAPAKRPPVSWPARLPERPDALAAVGSGELKRVNPFRGLMVDETTWADAHDYHRTLARLHLLAGHGWGIVEGLEVIADERIPDSLLIRPGIAIDPQGRALIVSQERRVPISPTPGATIYLTAHLREELTAPQRFWNDLDEFTRVIERCETVAQTGPPKTPSIELARLTVAGPIRNAASLLDPQPGEIDLRFRERLLVRPRPNLVVGQLLIEADEASPGSAHDHRLGLRFLLREIGLTTPFRPRWVGATRLGLPLPAASLLYLSGGTGFAVGDAGVSQLQAFLQAGGILFADACAAGEVGRFAASVAALAATLGRELQSVGRYHPLLSARHIFAQPPLGPAHGSGGNGTGEGVALAEADGLILSTADYGCAWSGGADGAPQSRDAIRAALELGVNIAVYARQRQRPLEAIDLEV